MRTGIRILILIALPLFLFPSSQQRINSILEELKAEKDDTSRVLLLNEIALAFADTSIDRSIQYAREALNLSNSINYRYGIALSNKNFGEIFTQDKKYQPAINYYLICIKIFEELNEYSEIAVAHNKIGKIYLIQNSENLAMNHFDKSIQFAEKAGDPATKALSVNDIGGIHYDEQNYDMAYEYFLRSLMISEEIQDSVRMAATYNNVGEIYRIRGEYNEALDYYNKSLDISTKLDLRNWLAVSNRNIGDVFLAMNNKQKAFDHYNKSLQMNIDIQNTSGIIESYISLGMYYLQSDSYRNALHLFNTSLQIAEKEDYPELCSKAAFGKSDAFSGMNMYDSSLHYYKLGTVITDSLFNVEKHLQITEMEARFEADRLNQQNALQEKEIRLYERNERIIRLQMIIAIGGFVFVLILAALIFSHQKYRMKQDRKIIEKNREIHETQKRFMECELQTKNNELMNFALHIVQKNEFLQTVKKDLRDLKARGDDGKMQKINELLMKVNQNLRMSTEIEEFQKNVDQVNREFFVKLQEKFPNLTENEKRLSALLRLNLSSKEIATLNNISIKAVEMGRYRLRKKIGLDTNDVLTDYLQQL